MMFFLIILFAIWLLDAANTNGWIGWVAQFLLPVISFLLGMFKERNKNKAEAEKTQAEADDIKISTANKIIAMWEELANELQKDVQALKAIVKELKRENAHLHSQIQELNKKSNNER